MTTEQRSGGHIAASVLLPLTLGVLVGGAITTGADASLILVATVAAIAVASLAVVVRGATRARAVALLVGGVLGAGRALVAAAPLPPDHIARQAGRVPVAVAGTIVETARVGDGVRLVLRATRYRSGGGRGRARGRVGVTIAHPRRIWLAGMPVRVVGRLRRPRNFGDPGEYDARRALARRRIVATMFLWDDDAIALREAPVASGVTRAIGSMARARQMLGDAIDAAAAEPARGFLHAVLLGEDGALAAEERRALARTGLSHVISVSGFHLAVVAAAAVVGGRWLLLRCERLALATSVAKLAALAALPPVAVYAALAGGSVPASRSLLMYAALLTALLADRRADGIRSLAAAALVLGVLVPDVAADISFELSFVSVVALILTARAARAEATPPRRTGRIAHLVAAPLRVSCAAAAATAPLTAWHFQQVSLVAPVANLVALPLLGPATLLPGLAALPVVGCAPALARALLWVAGRAAALGLALAHVLASAPAAAVETPMPNLFEVLLAYAFVVPLAAPPRSAMRRTVAAVLVVVTAGDVAYWTWERLVDDRLRVTFLAVGQGDAAVVELPRGGVVVVDGGGLAGGFDPGERLVAPFLRSRKIMRLDALALSHPQLDHYGGLAYLAAHFAPREFWSNGTRAPAAGFARLEQALADAGTQRVVLRRGMTALARRGVRIDVLHPSAPDAEDPNNGSLVLRVAAGGASVLFTGDLEHAGELEMLSARDDATFVHPNEHVTPPSVVLKVPHHGSATSSSAPLLAATAPRIAVVSAGAGNRFGFPAAAVVARLRAAGAEIWRTDEDGAVQIAADAARVVVRAPYASRAPRVLALVDGVMEHRFEIPTPLW